jgi:two-component system, NarL family, sensor histidine kinase DesK
MTNRSSERDVRDVGWTPFAWLVYLLFYFVPLITGHPTTREVVWSLVAVAVFLPLYFEAFRSRGRRQLAIAWAIHGIALAVVPINPAGASFFIYAVAFLGFATPPREAFRWLALMLALMTAQALWLGTPDWGWLPALAIAAVVGATNVQFAEMRRKDRRLRVAQAAVEEMARIAERERIGRDLHDLLGHTLSVIVLKSELAARLAERNPARATAEIRDVERISREALAEVRGAVSGYRADGLKDELANAERVLLAAGISPRSPRSRRPCRRTRIAPWPSPCGKPSPTSSATPARPAARSRSRRAAGASASRYATTAAAVWRRKAAACRGCASACARWPGRSNAAARTARAS